MKIGIVSDSHGNFENLKKAGKIMLEDYKVDMIIHLGDDSHELEVLKDLHVALVKVPGIYEECYMGTEVPNRLIKDFSGWKCLLTHTKERHENDRADDINPEEVVKEKKVHIVFYGHSHIPAIAEEEGILFVNPGHLKDEDKKGFKPSYGIAEFLQEKINIKIMELEGKRIFKEITVKKQV